MVSVHVSSAVDRGFEPNQRLKKMVLVSEALDIIIVYLIFVGPYGY
jgi:hypothetical protein